jgi:cell wall-associated NlpC family hydrolase
MGGVRGAPAWALGLALMAGCATAPRPVPNWQVKAVPGPALVKTARSVVGKPYAFGGHDPSQGFDCSGLVWWAYYEHGSHVPHKAFAQYELGIAVARRDLRPGDLVFFDTGSKPKPGHVGIYVGNGRFIHAPSAGERVREDELANNYWKKTWYGARRIE